MSLTSCLVKFYYDLRTGSFESSAPIFLFAQGAGSSPLNDTV